jgi:hypothetical protein
MSCRDCGYGGIRDYVQPFHEPSTAPPGYTRLAKDLRRRQLDPELARQPR